MANSDLTTGEGGTSATGASPNPRVTHLNTLLEDLCKEVEASCSESLTQVVLSFFLCVIIVICGVKIGKTFYDFNYSNVPKDVSIIYFTTVRLIIVTAFTYILTFCFRLLKSYLQIYQRNRHRKFVVKSMANLIATTNDSWGIIKEVYMKILEIITNFDDTGILTKEKEVDTISIAERLLEIILKSKKE